MQSDAELQRKLHLSQLAEYTRQKRKLAKEKQGPRPTVNVDTLAKLGINTTQFNKAYDELCKRWWDEIPMMNEFMYGLVPSTLAQHLNEPVVLAMIADDVELFKKYFTEKKGDIFCLEFCCLCGSEKIINDLYLGESDKKKCLMLSKNAIGYALSSGNIKLTMTLVTEALKLGKTDPGVVLLFSSFGNYNLAEKIENMFPKHKEAPINLHEEQDPDRKKSVETAQKI